MANDRYISITTTAGQTALAFDFLIQAADEVKVTRTRASVITPLVLLTDYNAAGFDNDGGGTVTLTAAALAGDVYEIEGYTSLDRLSDYDPDQVPSGDQIDADLNLLHRMAAELRRDVTRHLIATQQVAPIELRVAPILGGIQWRQTGSATWNDLLGLTYPAHGHTIGEITGLAAQLAALTPLATFTGHGHAVATPSVDGFLSAADKTLVNAVNTGGQVGYAYAAFSAASSTTATIPYDDTIPQITEGAEFMTVVYTPKYVGSVLEISGLISMQLSSNDLITVAIFRDAVVDALAASSAGYYDAGSNNDSTPFLAHFVVTAINPITFRVRAGAASALTLTVNGKTAARKYGTIPKSWICVKEIKQ
jgi:hypothetical protein